MSDEMNNLTSYQLPNGQEIYHINAYETDFVVKEIFIDHVYFQHGISLSKNAVVFDVGANIGLFSLYVAERFPTSRLYAFEPSPDIYSILLKNLSIYQKRCQVYAVCLYNDIGKKTFCYYPGYSVISGLRTNIQRDAAVIINGVKSSLVSLDSIPDELSSDDKISSLVQSRLSKKQLFECQTTTISSILQQQNIKQVDLLKIDVEGAEWEVLAGIRAADWHKIRQVVIEIHCRNDVKRICQLIEKKGFDMYLAEDSNLGNAGVFNLFAKRELT